MSRRLLVSSLPGECRWALLENDDLLDLAIERDDRPSLLGACFLGRVHKVEKGLDGAFLDIGRDEAAFLPLGECPGRRPSEGDLLAVRVLRDPVGTKGPKVSARLPEPLAALAAGHSPREPGCVTSGLDPLARLAALDEPIAEVVCDEPARHAVLRRRLTALRPDLAARLSLDREAEPLFERAGIEGEIEALLHRRVDLPSGGHLLVEPVETLTAIDVNSGPGEPSGGAEATARRVNREALPAIARQLRLRAIGGLIAIDFLELRAPEARKQLLAEFKRALRDDPEPYRLHPVSDTGLMEMNRRRGRPALHELLTLPRALDPLGLGRRWDPAHLSFQALRRLRAAALQEPAQFPALRAAPEVAAALGGIAAAARRQIEAELGRAFELRPSADCPTYEIVLG